VSDLSSNAVREFSISEDSSTGRKDHPKVGADNSRTLDPVEEYVEAHKIAAEAKASA